MRDIVHNLLFFAKAYKDCETLRPWYTTYISILIYT